MISIGNEILTIRINSQGAELKSLYAGGFEYLWQGDPAVWGRTAPVLFPVVGKPFNNELLVGNQVYPMPQHGFARDMPFQVTGQSEKHVILQLAAGKQTMAVYPYDFVLELSYEVIENKVVCGYRVMNRGDQTMYFGIGAHPGFNLPLSDMSQYVLAFEMPENAPRFLLEDGLLNGKSEHILSGTALPLNTALFDKDAIVFKNLRSRAVTLRSVDNDYRLKVEWDKFPYLGIWSKKGCQDFLCIEPWCGIAGSTGEQVQLAHKEGVNELQPGKIFERKYTIIPGTA